MRKRIYHMYVRNILANSLTYLRLASTPIVIYLLLHESFILALSLFCAACATDYLDGFFAKRWKISSDFGAFLDAFADKVFVASIGITLVSIGCVKGLNLFPFIIIIWRELFISSVRMLSHSTTQHSKNLPRIKTFCQMTALSLLIGSALLPPLHAIGVGCLWIACIVTLVSVKYYWKSIVTLFIK